MLLLYFACPWPVMGLPRSGEAEVIKITKSGLEICFLFC